MSRVRVWFTVCALMAAHTSLSSAYSNRQGSCNPGQFQCRDGKCISADWVCDGDEDCDINGGTITTDESDEEFCKESGIASGSFMGCKSDRAIPQEYVCDGIDHCQDGFMSDELHCPFSTDPSSSEVVAETTPYPPFHRDWTWSTLPARAEEPSTPEYYTTEAEAVPTTEAIIDEWTSFDTTHMPDNSSFPVRVGSCNDGEFQCDSGKCVDAGFVCDNDLSDCDRDGSDEQFCKYKGIAPGSFMGCKSNRAIPRQYVCDGIDHCRDGFRSDELGCQSTTRAVRTPTPSRKATVALSFTQRPMIPLQEHRGPIYVGSRVVRGPEWIFDDEDCGPSSEGEVKSISRGEYIVSWECGTYGFYSVSKAYLNPILHKADLEEGDEVVRGPGWDRSDQDGGEGNVGHVMEKSEIEMVKVKWSSTGEEDWYMGSSQDKYDLLLVRRNLGRGTAA